MLTDLADLTPPLVVCAAIIVTVVLVLRHQMAPRRHDQTKDGADDSR
jgi:hypothetical protein